MKVCLSYCVFEFICLYKPSVSITNNSVLSPWTIGWPHVYISVVDFELSKAAFSPNIKFAKYDFSDFSGPIILIIPILFVFNWFKYSIPSLVTSKLYEFDFDSIDCFTLDINFKLEVENLFDFSSDKDRFDIY